MGAGGRAIGGAGGRTGITPAAGGTGFGATNDGGRTGAGAIDIELGAGGRAALEGPGGRAGKLIRAVSFSTGTVGRFVVRGGSVMRTVSFFGSFRSAILLSCNSRDLNVTGTCLSSQAVAVNHQSSPATKS
jgi:hypothetical protein